MAATLPVLGIGDCMASRDETRMSNKALATWLAVFVLLAIGLRIGWNVDASFDEDSERYLYSGNDPYYHDRAVNHILETGESLQFDPALNFPAGANNPNPPVFDWTSAVVAGTIGSISVDPAGMALNLMTAVWGALAVIPVFIIGAELWNRRAGLWAAFFMAVSAPHIQRGVWGFADHDAATMFWILCAVAFLVKGLKALDDREYVKDWRHRGALAEGVRNSFAHNRVAMLWSALAGVALSATALTWKGYPYVLAIMAVAFGMQLLWDHVKNRDSTALTAFYLLPMILVTLIPLPYYLAFPNFLDTTIWAGIYVLIGMVVVSAILVPTRDLPSILVFPALLLTLIAGWAIMVFAMPNVGQTVFTGLGYFQQTKLFGTIAEAQRSELGRVAASFGFFTFLLAFWGLGGSIKKAWKKGNQEHMLMVSWAIVALFMAFAASRFIMNASPVFALLAGAVMPIIVAKLGFEKVRRAYRQQHGTHPIAAGLRSLNMRTSLGVLLVFVLFILPNTWIGVDAAIPCEVDDCTSLDTKHLGAFGLSFDIKDNGWLEAFTVLAQQDTEIKNIEDRPGFIAWWDYGHWATDIGMHPTVADPFQNNYNIAGRFLASESEQEAVAWMTLLSINVDYSRTAPIGQYSPHVEAALRGVDAALIEIGPIRGYDKEYELLSSTMDLTNNDIFDLYEEVTDYTGVNNARRSIEYIGVDSRMYPVSAQNPGIFYAPAYLANKNPDNFTYQVTSGGGGLQLRQHLYDVNAKGDSFRIEPYWEDQTGGKWLVTGGQAFPFGTSPAAGQGIQVQWPPQIVPTQSFFDSMYARSFGSQANQFTPADGLTHWRVLHESTDKDSGVQQVELLAYYRGVNVSGTVLDDAGQPVSGAQVTFVDGLGASHAVGVTDASGFYQVLAPFSVDGDLTLVALNGGVELASRNDTSIQFNRVQARLGESVNGVDLTVQRGSLTGTVFQDVDGDGVLGANDTRIAGASVTVGGQLVMSGADGSYALADLQPGVLSATVTATGYNAGGGDVTLAAGETASKNFALAIAPSKVLLELRDQDGAPIEAGLQFTITDAAGTATPGVTDANGFANRTLAPGDYSLSVDISKTTGGEEVQYSASQPFSVPFGGSDVTVSVTVTKS